MTYGNTFPVLVGCRCGWEGTQDRLLPGLRQTDKYCPRCGRYFKPRPYGGNDDGEEATRAEEG